MNFENMRQEIDNIEHSTAYDPNRGRHTFSRPTRPFLPQAHILRQHSSTMVNNNSHYESNKETAPIITHAHINGLRNSVEFPKKSNYTFEELLIILNFIDVAWESRNNENIMAKNSNNYIM